ncbi:BTB domain-containing protein [Trichonephila inaurata madagascariensis]|uniref:Structure-specific endonuclease subunit SLX4 n=1 Tax=Trichonephila inaurata madagascariensis TaxID=2747483 RepID=A0A8X7BQ76_9ARAC|nr:BTB domain-containing protein [Trichonephila inaurata madagascariensis]
MDETDDFQESQIGKKLKKRQESSVFICIVCQTDLAHLNLEERSVHINQCIDSQSSDVISSQEVGTENVFILECPLCFKHFSTPELRCTHIKKCGKSRGLSSQSVIQAIHLQEKHVLERRALGLPLNNKPAKQPKKPVVKNFFKKPKSALESDLHLAKALSLSLNDKESQSQSNFSSSENILSTTGLQPPAEFQNPGRVVPKKHALKPTPILLLRTEEERQKILLEKVNAIIAAVSETKKDAEVSEEQQSTYSQQTAFLWNLSSKAENKKMYYVEQLMDWISPTDVEVGAMLSNLSQIPGHHIFTQQPCDYTFSCTQKSDINSSMPENNSLPSLMDSLQSLVGNSWMSDVDIHTDGGCIVPAHKLLLALRYPILKNELNVPSTNGRYTLHWENISLDAAKLFLNFIYTGSAEWKDDTIDELYKLALSYEVTDLLNILNSNNEALEILANGMTQEIPTLSFVDAEISNEEKNQVVFSDGKQGHDFVKSSQIFVTNDILNCRSGSNEDFLNERVDEINSNFVVDPIDRAYIKETNIVENVQPQTVSTDSDICILNVNNHNHITNENCEISSNVDACNNDSNSSNDSCKILKTNISSVIQKSFDTCEKQEITVVSPEKFNMSHNEVYDCADPCILSYHTPTKPSQEDTDFSGSSPHSFERTMCIKKVSPFKKTPRKNMSENISPEMSLSSMLCVEKEISTKNLSYIMQESFENRSNFSQNLRDDEFVSCLDEAVIVLDDEQNNSDSEKYPVNENMHKVFSPLKNAHIPSTSFYSDCSSFSTSLNSSVQFGSTHREKNELDSPKSFNEMKNAVSPPKEIKIYDEKELQTLSQVNSFESSKIDYQNKNSSCKKSIENCLNDDICEMNISSPEILICDSDNEVDPLLERNSFKSFEDSPKKKCRPDDCELILGKNYFKEHDKLSGKEIDLLSSTEKNKYSSTNLPEIIYCELDSNTIKAKTIKSSKPCSLNDINNIDDIKLIKSNCTELKINSEEHSLPKHYEGCVNEKNNKSPVVFDVIDCQSDPNDDEIIRKEALNNTKEIVIDDDILDDECMNDIPLLERIQMNQLKTGTSKNFKDLLVASPESPWNFQASKYQQVSEKDSNSFKDQVCWSQQNSNVESKSVSKDKSSIPTLKEKAKESCASSPNGMNPKFKLSDSPITPLPDFKSMMTPQLKEALKRVGVKALSRKKAVAVLSHIYDETHPWNDDHSGDQPDLQTQSSSQNSDSKRNLSLPKKRKQAVDNLEHPSKKTAKSNTNKSKEKKETAKNKLSKSGSCSSTKDCIEEKQIHSSENKTSSSECSTSSLCKSGSPKKNNVFNFSQSSEFSDCSQAESKDDPKLISEYISSKDELYKKVLTYTPLNLMELQCELKENGIRVSVKKLMDYLDEQCITFTCPRKEEYKKKQQAHTQRFRKRMIAKLSQQKNFNAS